VKHNAPPTQMSSQQVVIGCT